MDGTRPFYMASAEDTLLHKLEWYRIGNEVSDRQWNDILAILKIRGPLLDIVYLRYSHELRNEVALGVKRTAPNDPQGVYTGQ